MAKDSFLAAQLKMQDELHEKLTERGYSNMADFLRSSGLIKYMSFETLRRVFNDHERLVAPLTMVLVMRFLEFPHERILEVSEAMGGSGLNLLIEKHQKPELWETGLIGAVRALRNGNPDAIKHIADLLETVGRVSGVDVSSHTSKMRAKKRTRKIGDAEKTHYKDEQNSETQNETH
jgi:hypothetical protein